MIFEDDGWGTVKKVRRSVMLASPHQSLSLLQQVWVLSELPSSASSSHKYLTLEWLRLNCKQIESQKHRIKMKCMINLYKHHYDRVVVLWIFLNHLLLVIVYKILTKFNEVFTDVYNGTNHTDQLIWSMLRSSIFQVGGEWRTVTVQWQYSNSNSTVQYTVLDCLWKVVWHWHTVWAHWADDIMTVWMRQLRAQGWPF